LDGVNAPVPLVELKVTVPVGELPVTLEVQVVEESTTIGEGEHDTEVMDEALDTVKENVPELAELATSPP
jgi:hypothetical protein